MKIGLSIQCSALALLFLACGSEKPATAPATNPTPAPATTPAPAKAPQAAPTAAPVDATAEAPQNPATQDPGKKPVGPVRVNYDLAKVLFGNEPAAPAVADASPLQPLVDAAIGALPAEAAAAASGKEDGLAALKEHVAKASKGSADPAAVDSLLRERVVKVALGKALFHEKSLSKDGSVSCASCHDLANYGQDGKATSAGAGGKHGERNTPSVYNAARQYKQFWDARADTIEDQALMHVLEPDANGVADEAELVKKIKEKADLVAGFQKAFPGDADAVSAKNFKLAMGAFERSLVTKSRFDAYLDGDQKALSNEEKLGLKTFMDVGCTQCHMSRLVGGNMLQKLGVLKPHGTHDTGRERVTKSEADKFFFKVSSLLNVEKTGPYQHDGKMATLEEAVANMASVQLDKTLKPEEIAALVAFLKALTGPPPDLK